MLTFENQNVEFKQEYVPDIHKEVMGFANAEKIHRNRIVPNADTQADW